jgi:class 3 adenylate cyclase/predicted ATPase
MQQIADWLKKLGMSEYAERFAENDLDMAVLPDLTDQHLKELGVSLGHRLKMLRAIRDLGGGSVAGTAPASPAANLSSTTPKHETIAASVERRQLTVMFCDLVGSTALSARLDPEDLRGIMTTYHHCCTKLVERNGGFVAKYMGDGVLAYFGYPQAHEHDAERAVRAGLHLVETVPKLTTVAAVPLQVRIGIATGLVVVGDLIGAGAAQEQAVVGETPNLAARLQALAEPGAVVIAASTRTLTGGLFEYRDLGTLALKGFAENVPAWQVLGAGTAESRFEALRATTTPLIGRDEEIDLLMRRWEQAKRGDGQVVLISGEPGIGKSRIVQIALARLSGEPHARLRSFCSPHHQDSALYPTIAGLERAAGFSREDTAEQRLNKLEAMLGEASSDLREAVPLLAALLSIPTGDRYQPLDLSPQKQKEKMLNALLARVESVAAKQPVLIVWEDVHWSDPTSRELLDLTVDRVSSLSVLSIITFRPEFAPPWVGRSHVTLLTLNRLPPRRRVEMIALVTGGKALPIEVTDQISDRTDGVPLFIEELTKAVIESGALIDSGDHYTMAGPLPTPSIPTSLNASLLARLDRLPSAREVAQIAAALGRHFSYEFISAVASMPQQRLDDALSQLVSSELIFQRGTPPNAEYTFKHALVQDAAYNTLLLSRRQQLHGRIVATLENQFPENVAAQPALLAQHCGEGRLAEKAIGYWLKAGQQAMARSAMTEAVTQLRKGLDLLHGVSEGAARQEWELSLQIALGHALIATKGYAAEESGEAFDRARQLCEQLGRPPQLQPVLTGQYVFRLVRAELRQVERHAEEIYRLGHAPNNEYGRFRGLSVTGHARCYLGKFIDARACYEKAIPLWDPMHRTLAAGRPEDAYVTSLIHYSRALLYLGHIDQGLLRRDQALTEARRLSSYNVVFARCHSWFGDWAIEGRNARQTMLQSAEEVMAISSERGFPQWLGHGKVMRGWCLGAAQQAEDGIPLVIQGLSQYSATGAKLTMPFFLMTLAELYGMAARPEEGLNRFAQASELVETTQECWAEAEMHRVRGTLLLSMNEHSAAEDSYRQALAVARQQSAKLWELRAAASLARLWNNQGKRTEARDLLAPTYGWFTEGLDTLVLQDAKALLDELT